MSVGLRFGGTDRNAAQCVPLWGGMTPDEILCESEYPPVAQSGGGVTLLLRVFAALTLVVRLFCVSGTDQSVGGVELAVIAIFF